MSTYNKLKKSLANDKQGTEAKNDISSLFDLLNNHGQ